MRAVLAAGHAARCGATHLRASRLLATSALPAAEPLLDGEQARTIAAALIEARRSSRKIVLPSDLAALPLEDGYAIQRAMIAWNMFEGAQVGGWTIDATSKERQAHMEIAEPISGPVFAPDIHHYLGDAVPTFPFAMLGGFTGAEPKFVFQLQCGLEMREEPYSEAEVVASIGSVTPALELKATRLEEGTAAATAAMVIADQVNNGALVLGDVWEVSSQVEEKQANKWGGGQINPAQLALLTEGTVALEINNRIVAEGMNRQPEEPPLKLLTWMANHLLSRGVGLQPRMVLAAGSALGAQPVGEGQQLVADFGGFGRVRADLR